MTIRRIWFGLILCAALPAAVADTVSVYKWIDGEGLTHYAEAPPPDRSADRIELDLPPASALAAAEHYYAIVNQAQRLEQARLQRERERAQLQAARAQVERDAAQAAAASAAAEFYQQQAAQPQSVYLPVLVPHRRPPHAHRPPPDRGGSQRAGRHPAYAPPEIWLRSHPRLLRQELRAQRDSKKVVIDPPRAARN